MAKLETVEYVEVRILSDNSVLPGARGMLGEHGFSALLESCGESVLFDTGQTGIPLVNNLKLLGIYKVEDVVLSHGHYDHSGGLPALISAGLTPSRIFTHEDAFRRRYKRIRGQTVEIGLPYQASLLESAGVEVAFSSAPVKVKGWLTTTGEVERSSFERPETEFLIERNGGKVRDGFRDDMGIIVSVEGKGLVVVTGCAHSGVINTVRHAMKITGIDRIYAVIGGFHLNEVSETTIRSTVEGLKALGAAKIVPCHCTGSDALSRMSQEMGETVTRGGVGLRLRL
ncbi:MAG: MBL fold metallo-hydrolase [Candidatus Verstraetearchaeota archaeon]|nr:MBL fold metallo-hydrolase [Candidatus Verstraetearchaeota archaeon]